MNPFEQMELKKMSLTKKELEVYRVFTENVDDILRCTATSMAEKYHVSQPAITRFCQKLGYQGYNDFIVNDLNKLILIFWVTYVILSSGGIAYEHSQVQYKSRNFIGTGEGHYVVDR